MRIFCRLLCITDLLIFARYIVTVNSYEAKSVVNYKRNQPTNTPPICCMLSGQYAYDVAGSKMKLETFTWREYRYLGKYYFDFIDGLAQPSYSMTNAKTDITGKNQELDFGRKIIQIESTWLLALLEHS
ncbi:hypothetical protein ACVWYG_003905 [Pedobacter sp. UYEF25]